jgi:hypothetical protein
MRFLVGFVISVTATIRMWSQQAEATQPHPAQISTPDPPAAVLKKFVQARVRQIAFAIDGTERFSYAFIDLNGDGKHEAIVYLTGNGWCGTGGCQLYILTPDGAGYKFVARIPATRPPIRVLNKISHGWHSVSVLIRDDATHMYDGEYRFNGEKYPLDVKPLVGRIVGRVVISGEQGAPLFP